MSIVDLCESLVAMLIDLLNMLMALVCDAVDTVMVPVAQALPDLDYDASFLYSAAWLANRFIALDYALYLFLAYMMFCLSVVVIKWVLALIPGMT